MMGWYTVITLRLLLQGVVKIHDYQFDAYGVSPFCAGVAASPSLISVSTIFRYALAVSISHSSLLNSYHVRSSMLLAMPSVKPAERRSWRP